MSKESIDCDILERSLLAFRDMHVEKHRSIPLMFVSKVFSVNSEVIDFCESYSIKYQKRIFSKLGIQ